MSAPKKFVFNDPGITETPQMDFPQAFEFIKQNALDKNEHHPKCSYRQAGMLCDCSILWAEYYKRRAAALEAQAGEQYHAAAQLAEAVVRLTDERDKLRVALEESVKLQSHYAELLNMHDGGQRRPFKDSAAWIERLIETGTLAAKEEKA